MRNLLKQVIKLKHMPEYLTRYHPVLEALRAGRRPVHQLWYQKEKKDPMQATILSEAQARGVRLTGVGKQELGQIAHKLAADPRHQGVLAEVGPYPYSELSEMLALAARRGEAPLLLLLDLVHGPQNIGTLLRTAEACGVHGVVVQDRRAPEITPAVVQYSAGAAEHLLIAQVTNLAQAIRQLQEAEVWVAGLDLDESARPLNEVDLNLPLAVVVGHEGEGLRRLVRERCDFLIRLPMRGCIESLNAAVAGSILLYAAWQARGFADPVARVANPQRPSS
jgi:23S rRNA (guanosine2251-2'-O)-methyltransferase